MRLRTSSTATALLLLPLVSAGVSAETLYFNNKRTIEVTSYQVKGPLIYVTMTNGRTVYLRADSVDWEGTQRLKQSGLILQKTSYESVDEPTGEEGDAAGGGRRITASDLKKGVTRMKRAVASGLIIDVAADKGWVDSRISVRAGQAFGLHASGRVTVGAGLEVGPTGAPEGTAGAAPLVSGKPYGALLLRIGLGSDPVVAGGVGRMIAPADGRLFFAVNDRTPEDNTGEFSVRVDVTQPGSPGASGRASGGPSGAASGPGAARSSGGPAPSANPRNTGMQGGVDKAKAARGAAQARERE